MDNFDFYISSNGRFIAKSYGIDYLVDISSSTIPSMPEAEENSATVAGRDGDIVLSTNYKPLSFEIVCYTNDNLSVSEKSAEERKVNKLLNDIKNTCKKFAIEKDNKFFEVKYSGMLTSVNNPKHISFSIPFKSSNPYAFKIGKKEIVGNGTAVSSTIKDCGAIFTIDGPATNPIISLNNYSMEFAHAIVENAQLIIDTGKSTVTHISPAGLKTNQMKYYNHQFPKIQNGSNQLQVLSGIDDNTKVKVEWYDLML